MSMFAKIILDSVSNEGIRLTTFHLRYWRPIHSELMTHKVFSRNARSSRAVPSKVLLTESIFTPQFGMNQPGMQSDILASPELQEKWAQEWQNLAQVTREQVDLWQQEGMHKQHANRPLEWFGWIDVLVSSTYWKNFYNLRISEYAQPEFDALARVMFQAQQSSRPMLLQPGEWHLPYITDDEKKNWFIVDLKKLSTARCARLSYKPFDGSDSLEKEIQRYEALVVSRPVHASPAEHQATPDYFVSAGRGGFWSSIALHGNFHGWVQHRKTIPHEAEMETFSIG